MVDVTAIWACILPLAHNDTPLDLLVSHQTYGHSSMLFEVYSLESQRRNNYARD